MATEQHFEGLTCRGLMLLRRLGNGAPSLSQMEFAQKIVSLFSNDPERSDEIDAIFAQDVQSRESIQRDSIYFYKQMQKS